eukprot:TRINITY_DN9715_c0_g1_i1.p1 TRINITY_DN9715_c0_g1~~TRINITY_DN9715_c0_g1_i1.p1  ORF type:complete len:227 (+),score=35.82 TRINITY_DN9715_c0_g1_i1:1-681(+)
MIRVFLVRHAQSESNLAGLMGRSDGYPLSSKGVKQATLLGKHFSHMKLTFDVVFASPAVRAQETARIASNGLLNENVSIQTVVDLSEIHRGDLDGQHFSAMKKYEPTSKTMTDPTFKAPGKDAESYEDVQKRMITWWDETIVPLTKTKVTDRDFNIGVFSHGVAVRCLLAKLLKIPLDVFMFNLENTSFTEFRFKNDERFIFHANDTSHLYNPDLIDIKDQIVNAS